MLDVGFSEILLTSAIALIVLGPERLPKVARQVGNWMGRARAMARQLSEQLEREVSADELLKAQKKSAPAADQSVGAPSGDSGTGFDSFSPSGSPCPACCIRPVHSSRPGCTSTKKSSPYRCSCRACCCSTWAQPSPTMW